jgi:arsenate reductase (glutaredoxin)
MAEDVIIYHNPKCAKSRETLQLLRDHGVEPQVVKYLEDPPSPQRVLDFIEMLGVEPIELLRSKEKEYKKLGLSAQSSKNDVARAIAAYPVLLERPIVVRGGKARLGRPPERVLEIL